MLHLSGMNEMEKVIISYRNFSEFADCVKAKVKRCFRVRNFDTYILMRTSTEKQGTVSSESYNIHSKAAKTVNKQKQPSEVCCEKKIHRKSPVPNSHF